jgi:MYXO-CTERM domain-containing protein
MKARASRPAALAAAPLAAHATPTYTVTQIADFGGGAIPGGLNNAGKVVGGSYTAANALNAYVGTGAGTTNLHPAGNSGSWAYAINDSGTVAGDVTPISGPTVAAVFTAGIAGLALLGLLRRRRPR